MKRFSMTLFLLVLAACAAPTQTTLSDGTVAIRIDCDASIGGMNYCLERAGKSCGAAGYRIVDQDGRTISSSAACGKDIDACIKVFETDQNSILVRCGE